MGTENFGRDVFSRFLFGTRVSMFVGLGAVALGLTVGTLLGMTAGLRAGSVWDTLIMRGMDVVLAFPLLVLVPVLAGILQTRTIQIGPLGLNSIAAGRPGHWTSSARRCLRGLRARACWPRSARTTSWPPAPSAPAPLRPPVRQPAAQYSGAAHRAGRVLAGDRDRRRSRGVVSRSGGPAARLELGQHAGRRASIRDLRRLVAGRVPRRSALPWRSSRSICSATRCATPWTRALERH